MDRIRTTDSQTAPSTPRKCYRCCAPCVFYCDSGNKNIDDLILRQERLLLQVEEDSSKSHSLPCWTTLLLIAHRRHSCCSVVVFRLWQIFILLACVAFHVFVIWTYWNPICPPDGAESPVIQYTNQQCAAIQVIMQNDTISF